MSSVMSTRQFKPLSPQQVRQRRKRDMIRSNGSSIFADVARRAAEAREADGRARSRSEASSASGRVSDAEPVVAAAAAAAAANTVAPAEAAD